MKKETGRPAQEYIQLKVIDVAKERLLDMNKSVSEIAYEMGFKTLSISPVYSNKKAGITPNDYRTMN